MSDVTGGATLGLAAAAVMIAPSDPRGAGTFYDRDGDKVLVRLTRPGDHEYFLSDADGDGHGPPKLVRVAGTNSAKSAR